MGYSTASWQKYPAIDIYNNMPYNAINIIHGHGAPGYVQCEYDSTWSGLYAYNVTPQNKDACMYKYASTALQRTKVIVFLTCNSATLSNGWSMATISYNRGAKFALGFNNSVAGAGEWNMYFMRGLASGKTIQEGLDYADSQYKLSHPFIYDVNTSPYKNHWHYGKSDVKVKL